MAVLLIAWSGVLSDLDLGRTSFLAFSYRGARHI